MVSIVLYDVYDMHFATSEPEFLFVATRAVCAWRTYSELTAFTDYFESTWLRGSFDRWQSFRTPPGYATAQDPVEAFNRKIQRDYVIGELVPMGLMVEKLLECCRAESTAAFVFAERVEPSGSLRQRVALLSTHGTVNVCVVGRYGNQLLANTFIISRPLPPFLIVPLKETAEFSANAIEMGVHYARMEVLGQPQWGWRVKLSTESCQCRYYFYFGTCVHVLLAKLVFDALSSIHPATVGNGTLPGR